MGQEESKISTEDFDSIESITTTANALTESDNEITQLEKQLDEEQRKLESTSEYPDKEEIKNNIKEYTEKLKNLKDKRFETQKDILKKLGVTTKDGNLDPEKINKQFEEMLNKKGGLVEQVKEILKKKGIEEGKETEQNCKDAVKQIMDDFTSKIYQKDISGFKKVMNQHGAALASVIGSFIYGCVTGKNCNNMLDDDSTGYSTNSGCVISSSDKSYMIGACGFPAPSMYGSYCTRTCDPTGENPYASPCTTDLNMACGNVPCSPIACTNNQCIYNYDSTEYALKDLVNAGSVSFCSSNDGSVESGYNTAVYECSTNALVCQTTDSGGLCTDNYITENIQKNDSTVTKTAASNIIKSLKDNDGTWTWSSLCLNSTDIFMTAYMLTYMDVYAYQTKVSPVMVTVQVILLLILLIVITKMFYDIYKKYK